MYFVFQVHTLFTIEASFEFSKEKSILQYTIELLIVEKEVYDVIKCLIH